MPFQLPSDRTTVMGVLNVTPDSFSDGGLFFEPDSALARAEQMLDAGADLIDVGGESTRPGAPPVDTDEELRRVLPVVGALVERGIPVSIDTSKHEVAEECLKLGAAVVNDVTALRDPAMRAVCAHYRCTVCLMHMQGDPRTMQADPRYDDVVQEVARSLSASATAAVEAGIATEDVWIDPGIGFGKTLEHNLRLLKEIGSLVALGYPVLVGVSRKSFLGRVLGTEQSPAPVEQRLLAGLAAQSIAVMNGARIVRTHDVAETRQSLSVLDSVSRLD